jgi:hypothetical protein
MYTCNVRSDIKTFGGNMPLFLILLCFVYNVHDTGIDVIHYCCMDAVGWKRQDEGLKQACGVSVVGIRGILRSKSVEELPSVPTGIRTPHIRGSNVPVSECPPA